MVDYSGNFIKVYNDSISLSKSDLEKISESLRSVKILGHCQSIIEKCYNQKGVFTVLVTLLFYKIHHPNQDIRLHKVELTSTDIPPKKGFSGRSFDTKYITPNLKKMGLPSMAESGWLTRSLEQAAPYDLDFQGKISGGVKIPFLTILNEVEVNNFPADKVLIYLLNQAAVKALENVVVIDKLKNSESITINNLVDILQLQFNKNYGTSGAAKLPMIAFHSIYQILLKEIHKYSGCTLEKLGSYTASDRTSKTAGDIEIFNADGSLLEAIEIKLNIQIDLHMLERAKEKIFKFNPKRYYILSTYDIKESERDYIYSVIKEIKSEHGCQVILNGVLHTLKYYFRLINNLEEFVNIYSKMIEYDNELKLIHKNYWRDQVEKLNS